MFGYYDVIVVGGGPAGVGSALSASRGGKKTLLIEQYGFLGGMWTAGLVNPLFDYENKGGIVQEIVNRINDLGMNSSSGQMYTFDIETMKLLLDRMMIQSSVDLLFHTYFADTIVDNKVAKGVLVENKSG
ncbi:MAG TPA: FAD-dependent oxidoreductase, partial [Clostridiales bacterium]|nr:FAD-dependent oxidoreductase [Clostridiales bacterium]